MCSHLEFNNAVALVAGPACAARRLEVNGLHHVVPRTPEGPLRKATWTKVVFALAAMPNTSFRVLNNPQTHITLPSIIMCRLAADHFKRVVRRATPGRLQWSDRTCCCLGGSSGDRTCCCLGGSSGGNLARLAHVELADGAVADAWATVRNCGAALAAFPRDVVQWFNAQRDHRVLPRTMGT